MKLRTIFKNVFTLALITLAAAAGAETVTNELTAAKDNFGRTNNRNRNNGGGQTLLVAQNSSVRTFVGFDLSSITNEIVGAEFSIRKQNTMPDPISLTLAPMVQTPGNAAWNEGTGALGIRGQNARVGESSFQWRAFRGKPWEDAKKNAVVNMMDAKLWEAPIARLSSVKWTEGEWITIVVGDVKRMEEIRLSEDQMLTFGLWGTAGNGTYFLCSKESGHAPKLTLVVKKPEEKSP